MNKIICLLCLASASALADPTQYVNFVRQIQEDSGVEWDVSVAPSGTMLSQEGVGPDGSLFQLWSIHSMTASEYHLDEEFVSAFTPEATITIQTADPYEHVARTRVDQPFSVRIGLKGLISGNGPDVPLSAKQVLLTHKAGEYAPGLHSFATSDGGSSDETAGGAPSDPYRVVGQAMINNNGNFALYYPITALTGPDLTKVEGEEVWTISALDGGENGNPFVEGEKLESATLQIWPIAQAVISGIDPTMVYQDLPPVTVSLKDLYPSSTTFVRLYAGPPSSSPQDANEVQTSFVIIQDSIPQNRVLTLDDLDAYLPVEGKYTLDVVHQTPFGVEVLNLMYPINIKRTVTVRGSVYSGE